VTLLDEARRIAEEVLFPGAMEVDATDRIPAAHLNLLASAGLYGVDAADGGVPAGLIAEALAGGCLATAFVWIQHRGVLRSVANSDRDGVRDAWLEPLRRGERRAGIALGALRPGPPLLRARRVEGGWVFDGEAPWVTGWGMIDTLHAAARTGQGTPDVPGGADTAVWALIDAVEGDTLTVAPLRLIAVNASGTVTLRLRDHFVPEERVSGTLPFAAWGARDAANLGFNGRLALGIAERCLRLAEAAGAPAPELAARLPELREALESDVPHTLPAARAGASELALRAASLLVAAAGARSVLGGQHAQRLLREAGFLLVFGSRPAIRDALLATFSRPAGR
jgi:alkylation response protein AidB-like acyl-CoA dehydrogenase